MENEIYREMIISRIYPYLNDIDKWWNLAYELHPQTSGSYLAEYSYKRFFYRFTIYPKRSPIKGIQIFPYILVSDLSIKGVHGGAYACIESIVDDSFVIDKFSIVCKKNLPSTGGQSMILAIIPTIEMGKRCTTYNIGDWFYLEYVDQQFLKEGIISPSLRKKIEKKLEKSEKKIIL